MLKSYGVPVLDREEPGPERLAPTPSLVIVVEVLGFPDRSGNNIR